MRRSPCLPRLTDSYMTIQTPRRYSPEQFLGDEKWATVVQTSKQCRQLPGMETPLLPVERLPALLLEPLKSLPWEKIFAMFFLFKT